MADGSSGRPTIDAIAVRRHDRSRGCRSRLRRAGRRRHSDEERDAGDENAGGHAYTLYVPTHLAAIDRTMAIAPAGHGRRSSPSANARCAERGDHDGRDRSSPSRSIRCTSHERRGLDGQHLVYRRTSPPGVRSTSSARKLYSRLFWIAGFGADATDQPPARRRVPGLLDEARRASRLPPGSSPGSTMPPGISRHTRSTPARYCRTMQDAIVARQTR